MEKIPENLHVFVLENFIHESTKACMFSCKFP